MPGAAHRRPAYGRGLMPHTNTPSQPPAHHASGLDRPRRTAPRTAVVLLAAVLGVALAAVPALAWDRIYGNSAHFMGPSVEFQSYGYWNVEEGDSVTVRFGKYNNLLMDSTMGFAARACTTCNVENAVAGVDFHTATGSASFPGNGHPRTSSDFTIRTIENDKVDGKRCFYIDVDWSGKVNYTNFLNWLVKHTKSGRQTHVMCILDDDKPPPQPPQPSTVGVSVSNASVEEGGTMTFTVAIAMAVGASFTVQPAITHSTTESGDFSFTASELSFAGTGAESKTFTVRTTEDSYIEGTESFDVALTLVAKPSNDGKLSLGTGRGTIVDDDYPELTISDASTAEGGRLNFTLTLDDAIPPGYSAFYVQPAITAGTATANGDYVAATPPLVRFQGTRNETKTVTVVTLADTVQDEPDETLTLSASAVSSAPVITTDTGTGTIRERTYSATRKPALAISGGGDVDEGSSVSWTVTLDKAASGPFTVTPEFTGTATGTTDYTVTAGSLLAFAGTANEAKTITIKALKDGTSESDETVLLGLTANRTDRVDDSATGSATIKNVDAPTKKRADWTVEITMGDATVTEGGTVEVDVDVYASNPGGYSCANLSFNGEATVLGGTATSGSDYSEIRWKGYGKSKQLGCANGHTVTHKLEVRTIGDSLLEGDETIAIGLKTHGVYNVGPIGNQWYRQLGNGVHGVVTITDDDTAGVSAANERVNEGATASVTVTATGSAVEGGYTLAPTLTAARTGTLAGRDYGEHPASLSFAGTADETETLSVTTYADDEVRPDKRVCATFTSDHDEVDVSGARPCVSIANTDQVVLEVDDAQVDEDDGMVTVTVTSKKAVQGGFEAYVEHDGTGTADAEDYGIPVAYRTWTGTAGETKTFTIGIVNDALSEGLETFGVRARINGLVTSVPSATQDTDAKWNGTVSIVDDDSDWISVSDAEVEEGGKLVFTVKLEKARPGGAKLKAAVRTVAGGATKNVDYTDKTKSVNFTGTKGETKVYKVRTIEDSAIEEDEVLLAVVYESGDDKPVLAGGIGTITDDDAANLTVRVKEKAAEGGARGLGGGAMASARAAVRERGWATAAQQQQAAKSGKVYEGHDLVYEVVLDKAVPGGFAFTPDLGGGTATSGTDYSNATGKLQFAGTAGETQEFTVSAYKDATVEGDENYGVAASVSATPHTVNVSKGFDSEILDADGADVTLQEVSAAEGDTLTFTARLNKRVAGGLTVTPSYANVKSCATGSSCKKAASTDYTANTTALAFTGTKGEEKTFTVATTENTVVELDKTFQVSLNVSNAVGTVSGGSAIATITNDDSAAVTVNDASESEGDAMTFTVTLDKAVDGGLTVTPSYTDGTAASTDYTENTTALTFTGTANETQTFTVATTEDAVLEANETFTVGLTVSGAPSGVTATDTGTGTITNDDRAAVTVDDKSASEGESATFTVTLSEAVQGGLTVTPSFTDVSAVEGTDYDENTGALSFTGTKGETQTFAVATTEDAVLEADETFTVGLTVSGAPSGVTATDTGTGTITNDDGAAVTVDDKSASEGESATFTVTLSEAVQGGLTVAPDFTDVTTDKSADYTENTAALSFTGTKGETQTFTVATTEDAVLEANETFTVGLTVSKAPSGVTATDTGTGTITNDDGAAVTVDDRSAEEGDSITFTVTLSEAVQGGLTVTPSFTDVTAVEGTDYDENTAALSFTGTKGETQTFTVDTTEDAVPENDETFTVGLAVSGAPSGVTATDTGTGTITDDDSAAVRVDDASVEEGGDLTFTVTLSKAVAGGLTVTPDFTDVTAVEGTDYDENTGALSFTGTKGETKTFTVTTTEDAVLEAGETFTVGLTVSGTTLTVTATDTGTGTITDDDSAAVTVDDRSAAEGDSITFTVTLSEAVQGGLKVTPSFTDVTAVEGTDYEENTAALSFTGTKGETQTFTVTTTEDAVLEANETFTVALTVSGTTLAVTATDTGTGTITNDDGAAVTVDDRSAAEGESITFTVTLSEAVQGGLTVTPDFTDVSAVEGTDYEENTAALSFTGTKGETQTFTVTTTEDAVLEANETFTVGLTVSKAPSGVTATDTGTGTITNDDGAAVTVDDASASEGESATFTVTLSEAVQGGLTVTPEYTDVTAVEGTDYEANTAALSFTGTKGETQTFTVATTEDAVLEAGETFTVGLTVSKAPSGVTTTDTGTGTITDDDSAAVTVDDKSAAEGDSIIFTVTLSAAVQGGLTVTPDFTDVTAVEGTDYDENTTALSFRGTKGETQTFTVATTEDAVLEAGETFTVGLTASNAPTGTTVTATDTGTGTITNDDSAAVTVDDRSAEEGESATFTVTLSAAVQGGLTVTPDFTDVTAVEGTDYDENTVALSFTGTKGETQTFTVATTEDAVLEAGETFTVGLTVSGTTLTVTATDTGTGTITNDDGAAVTVNDASADEGESMTLTVTLSAAVQGGLTVTPEFIDVTAVEGTDYDENTGALTFTGAKGETKTFTVDTTEDAVHESDETFTVGLTVTGAPSGVTATDTGTGTITDDDGAAVRVNDASAAEGDAMTFTVTLSAAVQSGLTVTPDFTDVSAVEGTDYDENTAKLSFTGTKGETKTFTVSTTEDAVLEGDETFTVGLTVTGAPSGVTATDTGTGTITDDDGAAVTVDDGSAEEGETMTFTVTLSEAVSGGLTVTPDYTDVTAVEGTDYDENTAALSFTGTKGETKTFTVSTTEDAVLEGGETFTVGLTVSGTTLGVTATDTGTGTITDDDGAAVTVDDRNAEEGEFMTFTVTLSEAVSGGLTVTPGYTNGTTLSTDYTANTTALSFTGTKGETKTFTVATTEDTAVEGDETFTVGLTVTGAPPGVTATDTGTGMITDDDSATVTVNDASVEEGGDLTFTATLDRAVSGGLTVTPGYTDVSAAEGTDYTANTTALSFTGTKGETKTFTVSTTEDAVLEGAETFTVGLTVTGAPSGVTATDTGTGTITDDDGAAVTVDDRSASEGESMTFTVTLSEAVQGGLTVKPSFTDVSAVEGTDYTANTTALSFTGTKGETKTFTVSTTEDAVLEAVETFTVGLAVSGTTLSVTATDTATGTIEDDDDVTVTVNDASATEGDSLTFTVTLDKAVQGGLTVTPGYTDVTAVAGTDYTKNTAALSFTGTANETRTFTVATTEDAVLEGDETFTVALTVSGTPAGTTVTATDTGTGTIKDDDSAALTVADASADEGDAITFTVTLDKAVQGGLTVTPSFTDVTTDKSEDYTENTKALSFTGTANETKTFTVATTEDTVVEGDETFTVTLAVTKAPFGVSAASATGTVSDDDYADLTLKANPESVAENAGATQVEVTATIGEVTFPTEQTVTVKVGADTDPAVAGTDYAAVSDFAITIAAGKSSGTETFTLTPVDDNLIEGDEQISVSGKAPDIGAQRIKVTLTDDDRPALQLSKLPEIALSANPSVVVEGDAPTTVTVTATVADGKAFPEEQEVTVTVGADGDSAQRGEDYARVSGFTITIAAEESSGTGTFTLSTIDDTVIEPEELITVAGAAPDVEVHGTGVAIVDDDYTEITLSADPALVPEDAGATSVTVTASTDGDTFTDDRTVTVRIGAAGDLAVAGSDYATVSGFTVTIPAGHSSGSESFILTPIDDTVVEGDETLTVAGASPGLVVHDTAVTIVDDDYTEITLSADPARVPEDAGPTSVTVTASTDGDTFADDRTVTVAIGADGDPAVAGSDYERVAGFTITIPAGHSSGSESFILAPIDDTVIEGDETLTVAGSSPGLVVHATSVTIVDDDHTEITLTADPARVPEDAGATTVTVTASTDGDTFADDRTVTVTIGAAGDPAVAGSDYEPVSGFTITIAAGRTSASNTFTLTPSDDTIIEGDETLTVAGASPGLVVHGTAVTIVDDDHTEITLTADPARVPEDAGATTVTVTASTDGDTFADDRTVTVTIGAAGDPAVAGTDYATVSGFTITIAAGRTSASNTFTLTPIDDTIIEGDEPLTVAGSSPGLVVHGTVVTIVDDDHTEITLTADPARVPEDAAPTSVTVTASTDGDTFADDRTVTVTIGADADPAVAGTDYETVSGITITIAAGRTSASSSFTLTPSDDTIIEGDETLTVAGSSPGLVVHGTAVTIVDDDHTEITLSADPARVPEEAAPTGVTVTASTDGDTFADDRTVTVTIGADADPAVAGTDYATVSGFTVTIAAGQTSGSETFTLTPSDDTIVEGDETLTVAGSSPGLVVRGTAVTIVDDDHTEITLSADPARVSEDADATTVTVTASTDGDTFADDRRVTVRIGAGDDPAVAGTDYATVSGFTVTIAAGQTSASSSFTLTPSDDTIVEGDETLTVAGTSPGLVVHAIAATIVDDDHTEITLSADPASVSEDAGATTVTVTAGTDGDTFADDRTVTVTIGADADPAEAGSDYETVSGFTITIAAGRTSASSTFTLTPIDDQLMEGDETLTVAGSSPGLVVHATAVTLAEDDHTEIAMTVDPPLWNEGDGPTTVTVTLTLTSPTVRFPYAKTVAVSVHESGVEPAVDFASVASFTITIPAGARSASGEFTLTPENDTLVEIAELITVVGQSAAAGEAAAVRSAVTEMVELAVAALQEEINVLTTASATAVAVDPAALVRESLAARAAAAGVLAEVVELGDDDAARISLAADPALVREEGGPRQVTVTATLQGAVFSMDRKIEVSLGAAGDGATTGVDYLAVDPFDITIPEGAGAGAATFTLTPVDDRELEEDETLTVAGTLHGKPVRPAQVTLRDDDEPAAKERFGRLTETLLPELSRAWTESVVEMARGCVAGPRAAADGGVQDLAGALHGSEEALNAGELSLAEALSGTALALPLATAEGADEAAAGAEAAAGGAEPGRITAWAKGDYRRVAGDGGGQVRWDGQVLGAHAGIDARLDHGYTGGVGVAWSEGTAEYTDQGGAQPLTGNYRSRLASVHPYLCWNGDDGSNAWGTVGVGAGLIEIDDEVAGHHESDALAATVAAGGSLRLLTGRGLAAADATALNLRSDASLTWHQVSGDDELISYDEVLTYRARLALTGTHVFALGGGGALSPEAELGVRWDGGAGATGLGLELGGGLGFAEPSWGLTAQLRGRALLVHQQRELRDWAVSGLLRLGPGESGEGLSLSVQPAYGAAAGGGVERLWAQGAAAPAAAAPAAAAPVGAAAGASLSTEIGYGVAAAGSGVLTPYAGLDLTDAARSYRLGGRLAVATGLDLALEGSRRETAAGDPLHQLALTAALTW